MSLQKGGLMFERSEPTTIGLSKKGHTRLRRLKEEGHFAEMADAYRFAIALALAHGTVAPKISGRQTIFNVGTLDSDQIIYAAISALREYDDEPVYSTAERLAEWGVNELSLRADKGEIQFGELLEEVETLLDD